MQGGRRKAISRSEGSSDLEAKLERIEEALVSGKGKDAWDKVSIVSTFLSSVVIAIVIFGVGLWFDHKASLREAARADREIRARELDVVAKFLPYLRQDSDESDKTQAVLLIKKLASVKVAAAVAEAIGTRGAEEALVTIARGELNPDEQKAVTEALRSLSKRNPVVVGCDGTFELEKSDAFQTLSEAEKGAVIGVVRATGKIKVRHHPNPQVDWLGTGFLVAPNLVVTAGYVVHELINEHGEFRVNTVTDQTAEVYFELLDHHKCDRNREYRIRKVSLLHANSDRAESSSRKELAFLEIDPISPELVEPTPLSDEPVAAADDRVVIVGYPAYSVFLPKDVQKEAFGELYNVKRLFFGKVSGFRDAEPDSLLHDAVTTGGVGGAPVVHLPSGLVIAMHSGGLWRNDRKEGFAVPLNGLRIRELIAELSATN